MKGAGSMTNYKKVGFWSKPMNRVIVYVLLFIVICVGTYVYMHYFR